MNDPSRPSLLERLSSLLMREPGDREQLVELLRSAHSRNLLDADALSIIEGALTVSEMQVPSSSSRVGTWPSALRALCSSLLCSRFMMSTGVSGRSTPFSARKMRTRRGFGAGIGAP